MNFKVGDKVQATKRIGDPVVYVEGSHGVVVAVGTMHEGSHGVVVAVGTMHLDPWPYRVQFQGSHFPFPVSANEIELYKSRWARFVERWFPAKDAEQEFGTEETVAAFKAVKEEARNGDSESDTYSVR